MLVAEEHAKLLALVHCPHVQHEDNLRVCVQAMQQDAAFSVRHVLMLLPLLLPLLRAHASSRLL